LKCFEMSMASVQDPSPTSVSERSACTALGLMRADAATLP
jgi:hypothetical protein